MSPPVLLLYLAQVADGVLKVGQSVTSSKTGKNYKVTDVGLLTPSPHSCSALYPGQVSLPASH